MAQIKVTLDVTGFYFSETIEGEDTDLKTVKDVMVAVVKKTAGTDREFTFKSLFTGKGEFCSKIQINYKKAPSSRQLIDKNGDGVFTPFPERLEAGIYGYDDENPTITNPQLAWQYYIVGENGTGALRSGEIGGKRTVVPFSDSNRDPAQGGVVLATKDVITWRLVAICGEPTTRTASSSGGVLEALMRSAGASASSEPVAKTPIKYRAMMDNR